MRYGGKWLLRLVMAVALESVVAGPQTYAQVLSFAPRTDYPVGPLCRFDRPVHIAIQS